MVTIIFETHSTSFDNEQQLSSGWNDVRLSQTGMDQAKQLGERYKDKMPNAVFCSDMKRSYQTATIAFDFNPRLIFMDWRLRECDYGSMTKALKADLEAAKTKYISSPFPGGESYQQVVDRMASFLTDLKVWWDGKTVMIIGHRSTQYSLENLLNKKPLELCLTEPWKWQPGWQYQLQ